MQWAAALVVVAGAVIASLGGTMTYWRVGIGTLIGGTVIYAIAAIASRRRGG
jgi:drug/metabolite transporter (DMT)-like permease